MIGQRIQILRKDKGMSLSELSNKAGIAKSYLSSIERGIQQNPSIQFLEKISAVLDTTVDQLVMDVKENPLSDQPLDQEWEQLIRLAMSSGVSKEEFKQFLRFNNGNTNRQ